MILGSLARSAVISVPHMQRLVGRAIGAGIAGHDGRFAGGGGFGGGWFGGGGGFSGGGGSFGGGGASAELVNGKTWKSIHP